MTIQLQPSAISPSPVLETRLALLVEDEALVAMIVEENLREIGFEPIVVATAAAAINALSQGVLPVLAVIDVGLPDERGDKLARKLRVSTPSLKIIIASGYDEAALKAQFADDDAIAVLGKPYTEDDLAQAIAGLRLGRHVV